MIDRLDDIDTSEVVVKAGARHVGESEIRARTDERQAGNKYKDAGDLDIMGAAKGVAACKKIITDYGLARIHGANLSFDDLERLAKKNILTELFGDKDVLVNTDCNPAVQFLKKAFFDHMPAGVPCKKFIETVSSAVEHGVRDAGDTAEKINELRLSFVQNYFDFFKQFNVLKSLEDARIYTELWFGARRYATISAYMEFSEKYPDITIWGRPLVNIKEKYNLTNVPEFLEKNGRSIIPTSDYFPESNNAIDMFSKHYVYYVQGNANSNAGYELHKQAQTITDFSFLKEKARNKKDDSERSSYRNIITSVHRAGSVWESKNVTPESLANDWGIKGNQFGNTVNDALSMAFLKNISNDFLDLSTTLDIDLKDFFSRCKEVGVAYGSRCRSIHNAHFEPDTGIMAFARGSGQGATAHEFAHLLDWFLANLQPLNNDFYFMRPSSVALSKNYRKFYLSNVDNKNLPQSIIEARDALLTSFKYSPEARYVPYEKPHVRRYFTSRTANLIITRTFSEFQQNNPSASFQDAVNVVFERCRTSPYFNTRKDPNYKIPSETSQVIADVLSAHTKQTDFDIPTYITSFYTESTSRKGDYWKSTPEMFARAFEVYIHEKMNNNSLSNNHLLVVPDHPLWPIYEPERSNIIHAFDVLFDALKKEKFLKPGIEWQETPTLKSTLKKDITDRDTNVTAIHVSLQSQDELFPEFSREEIARIEKERKNLVEHLKKPCIQGSLF